MGVRCRTEGETLEVVDGGIWLAKVFSGVFFSFSGFFLYYFVTGLIEYIRFATWKEWLSNLPGMIFVLLLATGFALPGVLYLFTKKQTLFSKTEGLIRYSLPFGPCRFNKTFALADVKRVSVIENHRHGTTYPPYTIEIMPNWVKVEIARFKATQEDQAVELGQQVAGFLGVELREERLDISRLENPISSWDLLKEHWRERRNLRKNNGDTDVVEKSGPSKGAGL